MLEEDKVGTTVVTLSKSVFPKGTKAQIVKCAFVTGTTQRAYCIQTEEDITGMVAGKKADWYLERDLANL